MARKSAKKRGLLKGLFGEALYNFVAPAVIVGATASGAFLMSDDLSLVGMFDDKSDRVTIMKDKHETSLSKDFMCRTRTHRCVMDLGDGILLSFADFKDFEKAKDIVEHDLVREFKGVKIPTEINRAMIAASIMSPYPYEHWLGKIYTESRFKADAYNSNTKARGIGQFLPKSGLEALYYMGKSGKYPFIPEAQLVERHLDTNSKGKKVYRYVPKDGISEKELLDSVFFDPMKSVFATEAYNKRYLQLLKLPKGETITSLHSYVVHWQGGGGAQELFDDYTKNPNKDAYTVFAKYTSEDIIANNKSMFLRKDGTPFTIEEMLDHISNDRGIGNYAIGALDPELAPPIQLIDEKGSPEINIRSHVQEVYTVYLDEKPPIPMPRPEWLDDRPQTPTYG